MGLSVVNGQTGANNAVSENRNQQPGASCLRSVGTSHTISLRRPTSAVFDWNDRAQHFTDYREPPREERTRRKPAVPGLQDSPPDVMDLGEHRERRAWVVNELEKIFRTYGNPLRKGSQEIESRLYDKSRNQDEYLALADKLLHHMRDLANQRGTQPQSRSESLEDLRSITSPSGSSPTSPSHRSSPGFTPNPHRNRRDSGSQPMRSEDSDLPTHPVAMGWSSLSSEPPFPPSVGMGSASELIQRYDINYGSIRLPAPNKRAFMMGPQRTTYQARFGPPHSRASASAPALGSRHGSYAHSDDLPEILTRLIRSDDEGDGESGGLSSDTYETSFKFLVPRNAVIKQITIHLKCVR
ncbi:uncharacterized protein LOC129580873 isoform X2 [Paramacrobiotus metropolitanus]|uniref:uncharacterized protein LOC129580873 isoform X2 n=1 Tax=Paramacrobiotus metropolitanus TaxID=2943436 RepID=UPI002445BC78|nr:uncharacterized protein LOC129580873 isoform X2 [Paramacrobiotus metropolitanus]